MNSITRFQGSHRRFERNVSKAAKLGVDQLFFFQLAKNLA